VAAVITNLAEEAPLVARMRDALAGEMNRRQQLVRVGDETVVNIVLAGIAVGVAIMASVSALNGPIVAGHAMGNGGPGRDLPI
jgi:DNA segregation ATPase FtsK/SpoIIIE-like protein